MLVDGLNSPDVLEFDAVPGDPGEQLVAASPDEAAVATCGQYEVRGRGYVSSDTTQGGTAWQPS
jgi:hypothetical protein